MFLVGGESSFVCELRVMSMSSLTPSICIWRWGMYMSRRMKLGSFVG